MNHCRHFFYSVFLILFSVSFSSGQAPRQPDAAEIFQALKKLNTLGSVLYVAAHPDDENTRLIAWLANEKHLDVTYLSLTRGDGGQNLIGPEIRELLGLIRTQELLMARSVDGGRQFFSRANDFGYSKSPAEALRIWGRDSVLSDVVWAIRKLRPDVIINRFSADTNSATHGHHTASAILSDQAFDIAADPQVFPRQLAYTEPWQPKRLFMNTSHYFYRSEEEFERAMQQEKDLFRLDVGTYYPLLGKSNTEIAAISRSMHRCQGFGTASSRGSASEYLKLLKGEPASKDIFESIDISWSRVEGGKAIGDMLEKVIEAYELSDPGASVPALLEVYDRIKALPDGFWKGKKLEELKEIIRACMGLYMEAVAGKASGIPGESLQVEVELVNRSGQDAVLRSLDFSTGQEWKGEAPLARNKAWELKQEIRLPGETAYSSPYWLREPWEEGMYKVPEQSMRGLPENPPAVQARFSVGIGGRELEFTRPLLYKEVDPALGEIYSRFQVLPAAFVELAEDFYLFPDQEARTVEVRVTAGKEGISGKLSLGAAEGWSISPAQHEVTLKAPGESRVYSFTVNPPSSPGESMLQAVLSIGSQHYTHGLIRIEYEHIPSQTVLKNAQAKLLRLDLIKKGERIAYIMGAGDDVPASLEQMGYQVDVLAPSSVSLPALKTYDALVTGIRAYNTVKELRLLQPVLMEYVKQGGTMIVQYNTGGLVSQQLGPYPLELGRGRVSQEDRPVRLLQPDHPLLNTPNRITEKDFENWVQERGLYFPASWDKAYSALLASSDSGEPPLEGGLLVASYGKGYYIYTGYSWFRQLPAGVPGAFRLFSNMISIGK